MRFYNTQSLLFTDEPFSDSTVFPIIDYDYIANRPLIGGELSYNSNVMVFQNQEGINSNRLIVEANWRRQMIDGIGQVFTPFAQLRGDIYGVSGLGRDSTVPKTSSTTRRKAKAPFCAALRWAELSIVIRSSPAPAPSPMWSSRSAKSSRGPIRRAISRNSQRRCSEPRLR